MTAPVHNAVFHNWHCDHFGHVNVRHYAAAFDDAIFALWGKLGADKSGIVPVTAKQTISFHYELAAGDIVKIGAQIVRVGTKSVTVNLTMSNVSSDQLHAECEVIEVFFSTSERTSALIPKNLRTALSAL